MNKKRKRVIVGAIICVLLIGMSVAFIYVAKYKEEHRYLTYAELPQDAIVFRVEMAAWDCYVEVWEYDVSGKRYFSTYRQSDPYDGATEELVSREIEEDYITDDEMKYMYESLLQVDKRAEYERLSHIITLDMSSSYFVGILYRVDGEVEHVYLARGQWERLLERMEDPNAKEICDWLLEL